MPRKRAAAWSEVAAALQGAKKATLRNQAFTPALARLGASAPAGEAWLHELKWDGYRLLATLVNGRCRLWSRNAIEWTAKVPRIAEAIESLGLTAAALDGELIAGTGTQADFNLLQATLSGDKKGGLKLALFDLLHVDGIDISGARLIERKELLAEVLKAGPRLLAYSSHGVGDGQAAFEAAAREGFEGIISKRIDAPYHPGRGDDWRKTKHIPSDEFAVVGYTPGKGARKGVGSLLLATPDPEHGWRYVGRVGTGFTDELLRQLTRRIDKAGSPMPTVYAPDASSTLRREGLWFEPMFVVEVFLRGKSDKGILRQPSLKAVRTDKSVKDLRNSDRVRPRHG